MNNSVLLPNFVVVGAAKAGTTSLFRYLQQHPDVYLPARKELHYFTYDLLTETANGPGDKHALRDLIVTRDEYENQFASGGKKKSIGDISPSYLYYDVQDKIKNELGLIKIVVMLRNPIDAAYSHYTHLLGEHRETLGFYEAILAEESRREQGWGDMWHYTGTSLYSRNVAKYIDCFGVENVHVILFDDFVSDTQKVLKNLFIFLGIDDSVHIDVSKIYNRSGKPRSKFLANLMTTDNFLKRQIKKMLPNHLRMTLRLNIMDANTGMKPAIDKQSLEYLKQYFLKDIAAIEKILGRPTGWLK